MEMNAIISFFVLPGAAFLVHIFATFFVLRLWQQERMFSFVLVCQPEHENILSYMCCLCDENMSKI